MCLFSLLATRRGSLRESEIFRVKFSNRRTGVQVPFFACATKDVRSVPVCGCRCTFV
uniref:Uncharacterized protein n=1 Tax=Anopheles minimus TaxID=112268 RepID=A0A182WQ41_9DIPT